MKKLIVLLLIAISLLSACSDKDDVISNNDNKPETVEQQELPKPGDPDFIGPLTIEQQKELNK